MRKPDETRIDKELIEPESRQMLKSAMKVVRLIRNDPGSRDHIPDDLAFDYSGVIIQLAKVFENELNLILFPHFHLSNRKRTPKHLTPSLPLLTYGPEFLPK